MSEKLSPDQQTEKDELIERYASIRAAIACNDAKNCTSYEEEFRSLFKKGAADPGAMTLQELTETVGDLEERYKEDGSPKQEAESREEAFGVGGIFAKEEPPQGSTQSL